MVGEMKYHRFPQVSMTGSVLTPSYTDYSINGELIKVIVRANMAGSLFLLTSGTNEPLVTIPNVSGTWDIAIYPRAQLYTNLGVALTYASGGQGGAMIPIAGPIYWCASGCVSGTASVIQPSIYYR